MPARSSSAWVPARGWFYVLLGLVIVQGGLLAGVWWRQPAVVEKAALALAPAALPTAAPAAVVSPRAPAPIEVEESTAVNPLGRDPLARALRTRPGLRRIHRFEELGASLARQDPQAAFRVMRGLPAADHPAFLRGAFDTLGRGDRHAAVELASGLNGEPARATALTTLLAVWRGEVDSGVGIPAARDAAPGYASGLGLQLLALNPLDAELVTRWAQLFTTGENRAALLGGLAGKLAQTDPARALALGTGLTAEEQRAFADRLFLFLPKDWMANHPQETLAWNQTLSDARTQEVIVDRVFGGWSQQDLPAAGRAALALPPGPAHENALHTVASRLAQQNTAAADAFAQSLSGRDRLVAAGAIEEVTPVGVGAALGRDEAGYPVISTLMDNMPAALSGQIRPGDRVVGVVRADGVLVDTSTLDLAQTANLVRGAANSSVQLQVARAQSGGGFAAPVAVTLIRQRLKRG